MLTQVVNHLWQSTVFAAVAGLLAVALRKNRAQVRYWLWLAASVKFLIPFSLLVSAGSQLAPRSKPVDLPVPVTVAMEQVNQTFEPVRMPAFSRPERTYWPLVLWSIGFASLAGYWFSRWRRMRTALRGASRVEIAAPIPVMCSPAAIEPGVFGILRPVLMLPQGIWTRMSPEQFSAILAHELCHVRRRDNLAAAIHMAVEALFWFHPLVWFVGARMVDERERACDEEVLRQGSRPEVYAEGILNVCKFYLQSPFACAAGVSGADLRKRIEAIMINRISPALTLPRRALIMAVAAAAVAGPVFIGMWNAPRGLAQSEDKLVFEVASIKPADRNQGGPRSLGVSMIPGGGIRGQVPVKMLILQAYKIHDFQLSGGPSWIASDIYDFQAKPEKFEGPEDPNVPPTEQQAERTRQRMKALLAERFQLAVHTETKEASVYVLSVAKSGHKMKPDPEGRGGVRLGNGVIDGMGAPMPFLAHSLALLLRHPVLEETGLAGKFTFQLTFQPQYFGPSEKLGVPVPAVDSSDDPRPSVFAAIQQQLGLQLQSKKGPMPVVTIDRIEKPTEN